MKELVVISGKGGAGKTSVVGALAALAKKSVTVDCDVDAADLHLLLRPVVDERKKFYAGKKARIKTGVCTACGKCAELCNFNAIFYDGPGNGRKEKTFRVDTIACEGCALCARYCTDKAIVMEEHVSGECFVSHSPFGPLVHGRLGIGEGNSGKMVSELRERARGIACEKKAELVIIDGPPGIACPVIAALTGAALALFVTEPSLSALHDVQRTAELAEHFNIPAALIVNKADINTEITKDIVSWCEEAGIKYLGDLPYDNIFTKAQLASKTVVEFSEGPLRNRFVEIWKELRILLALN